MWSSRVRRVSTRTVVGLVFAIGGDRRHHDSAGTAALGRRAQDRNPDRFSRVGVSVRRALLGGAWTRARKSWRRFSCRRRRGTDRCGCDHRVDRRSDLALRTLASDRVGRRLDDGASARTTRSHPARYRCVRGDDLPRRAPRRADALGDPPPRRRRVVRGVRLLAPAARAAPTQAAGARSKPRALSRERSPSRRWPACSSPCFASGRAVSSPRSSGTSLDEQLRRARRRGHRLAAVTHLSATIFLRRCVFSGVQPTTITIVTITVLDALQPLYVHEVVAMLHRRVAERRQKIHLGAVLHALGRQRGELEPRRRRPP